MYAALSNSDNLCNVTVLRNCRIKSIRWNLDDDNDKSDGHYVRVELSVRSTNQIGQHDSQGGIGEIYYRVSAGAAGFNTTVLKFQEFVDFPLAAGEKLYLHGASSLSAGNVTCYVDVAEGK